MKIKNTKENYQLSLMLAWAFLFGTIGYLLPITSPNEWWLSVFGGVIFGIYLGHSMGIAIYYLCKWRHPHDFVDTEP